MWRKDAPRRGRFGPMIPRPIRTICLTYESKVNECVGELNGLDIEQNIGAVAPIIVMAHGHARGALKERIIRPVPVIEREVKTVATVEHVIRRAAIKPVHTAPPEQAVLAIHAAQDVAAAVAGQRVVVVRSGQVLDAGKDRVTHPR